MWVKVALDTRSPRRYPVRLVRPAQFVFGADPPLRETRSIHLSLCQPVIEHLFNFPEKHRALFTAITCQTVNITLT